MCCITCRLHQPWASKNTREVHNITASSLGLFLASRQVRYGDVLVGGHDILYLCHHLTKKVEGIIVSFSFYRWLVSLRYYRKHSAYRPCGRGTVRKKTENRLTHPHGDIMFKSWTCHYAFIQRVVVCNSQWKQHHSNVNFLNLKHSREQQMHFITTINLGSAKV